MMRSSKTRASVPQRHSFDVKTTPSSDFTTQEKIFFSLKNSVVFSALSVHSNNYFYSILFFFARFPCGLLKSVGAPVAIPRGVNSRRGGGANFISLCVASSSAALSTPPRRL